jgi:hypothetical protein
MIYLYPYSGAEVLKRRRQRNAGAITEFPATAGLNIKEKNHVE